MNILLFINIQPLIFRAMKSFTANEVGVDRIEEATSLEEAMERLDAGGISHAVIDIDLCGMNAISHVVARAPEIKVLALSSHPVSPYPKQAFAAGALGFLTKDVQASEIRTAIRALIRGVRYITPSMVDPLANAAIQDRADPLDRISSQELRVLTLLAEGLSIQQIAKTLDITTKSVNTYRYRLHQKLSVETDVELAHFAIRHRLVRIPSTAATP